MTGRDGAEVDRLLATAEALIDADRGRDALAVAQSAIGVAPDDARPYCVGARALLFEGRHAEAAEMAAQAVARRPAWALPHRIRSLALLEGAGSRRGPDFDQLRDAIGAAEEAVRLAPADHLSFVALAQAYGRAGNHVRARQAAETAISLAPGSVSSWVTASVVAVQVNDWTTAEYACRRALEIDPNNFAAMNNLGLALRGLGKWKGGAEAFAAAARANPRSATARRNLARTGAGYLRLALLVLLAPLLLLQDGFAVFFVAAVGTNLLLYRYPACLESLERWTTPLALRIARLGRARAPDGPGAPGSGAVGPGTRRRTNRARIGDVLTWLIFFGLLVGLATTLVDGTSYALVFVVGLLLVVARLRSLAPSPAAQRRGGQTDPL